MRKEKFFLKMGNGRNFSKSHSAFDVNNENFADSPKSDLYSEKLQVLRKFSRYSEKKDRD